MSAVTTWVVVGGGPAGCVVAHRLAVDPSNRVIVLEAGPDHAPAADDHGPRPSDPQRSKPVDVRRRPSDSALVPYAQGHGLGGGSLINAGVVIPDGPGAHGGHDLPVEQPDEIGPVARALLAAHPSATRVLRVGRGGRRVTAADAYLRPVVDGDRVVVRTASPVERVLIEDRHATGVALADGTEVAADRIVVCGGAIHTPALLLRSGIDTPGLGHDLQDQPAFTITLDPVDEATHPAAPDIGVAAIGDDHQLLALDRLDGRDRRGALMVGLTVVSSRGRVTIDAAGHPVVELGVLATEADRHALAAGVEDAIATLGHPVFAELAARASIDDRGTPLATVAGDRDALRSWVTDHAGGYHHVAGTCRRGAVTDGGGWVRGYHALAVCDASLFDTVPRANNYLSVVLLAQEIADAWAAGAPPPPAG